MLASRSLQILQQIKNEIVNNPLVYNGRTAGEKAALINRIMSYEPKQYITYPVDKVEVIRAKIPAAEIIAFLTAMKAKGYITAADLADQQQEVLTRRCCQIGVDEISQGDVEEALRI